MKQYEAEKQVHDTGKEQADFIFQKDNKKHSDILRKQTQLFTLKYSQMKYNLFQDKGDQLNLL